MKNTLILILSFYYLGYTDIIKSIRFKYDDFSITRQNLSGVGYDLMRIKGGVVVADPGEPALPIIPIHFIIPGDEEVIDAEVISAPGQILPGRYFLFPAQRIFSNDEVLQLIGPEQNIYNSFVPVPERLIEFLSCGNMGGYRIASIQVSPFQYIPAEQQLIFYNEITVRLRTRPDQGERLPILRRSAGADGYYENFVKGLVDNPEDIKLYKPQILKDTIPSYFAPTFTPSPEGSPVEYLIITTPALANLFQKLADWRTKCGIPAVVRTTDWIYQNYAGCDQAEKIRNFLKDAYMKWGTIWVLLGGDAGQVPLRLAYEPISNPTWPLIPCDYYFSDLDGNWNFNGNSLFGEIADSLDMYPDLFVGRAPVEDEQETEIFINKVINYEKGIETDYQLKILMLAAWIDRWTNCAIGKRDYIHTRFIPERFQVSELYQKSYGSREGINRDLVIDSLNHGFNIVNQVDHTGIYNIGVGVSAGEILYRPDIDRLMNGAKTGIIFSCGCNVAGFNFDCIGEHFINNPDGGGVGFIGSSRAAFLASGSPGLGPIEIYDQNFFEALFLNNLTSIGATLASAKAKLSHLTRFISYYRYTHFALQLLGDPRMVLWTERPRRISVSFPDTIPLQRIRYLVTVRDSSTYSPVSGFRVILNKSNDFYLMGITNGEGQVWFEFAPEDTGEFSITVVKENYIPFEGRAQIVYGDSPRLAYHSSLIDDDSIPPSQGNNNRLIDAGETIELKVALVNKSNQGAHNVRATITTSSQYIEVLNNRLTFPDIEPGRFQFSNEPLIFRVDRLTPGADLLFRLQSDSPDTFFISVKAPVLDYRGAVIDDRPPGGNGNGRVEPCETVRLYIKVRNSGNGIAGCVRAILVPIDSTIIIDPQNDKIRLGDIFSGQEIRADDFFKIYTKRGYEPGHRVRLELFDSYERRSDFEIRFRSLPDPVNITYLPARYSIELKWDSVIGAIGYNVYRKDGLKDSFLRVNPHLIISASKYEDRLGINPTRSYFYKVTAVDSYCNESSGSEIILAYSNLAFLDGWPVKTAYEAGLNPSSPGIADLDGDGDNEIVIGAGTKVFAWHHNGQLVDGWPVETDNIVTSTPALADIDNDRRPEILIGSGNAVSVLKSDGTVMLRLDTDGQVSGAPVVFDLDLDEREDITVLTRNNKIYLWHSDGTPFPQFPLNLPGYPGYTSPAIGDLDGDGFFEIIAGFVKNWDPPLGGLIAYNHTGTVVEGWDSCLTDGVIYLTSPVVGDIDRDQKLEVVMGFAGVPNGGKLVAYEHNGGLAAGFPVNFAEATTGIALADLDRNGTLEIVAGSVDGYYIVSYNGTILSNKKIDGGMLNEPAVGDIDGDGKIDIIIASYGNYVYAFDRQQNWIAHFPLKVDDGTFSSPILGDLNTDRQIDIGSASLDAHFYCWSFPGPYREEFIEWPTHRHDQFRTGNYHIRTAVNIESENLINVPDGREGLTGIEPNPVRKKTILSFVLNRNARIEIALYNCAGRRLFHRYWTEQPGRHRIILALDDLPAGVYFCHFYALKNIQTKKIVLLKN
ncbi:MAG: C25 family cysteine peptidase [candidate division WOR-3 bacterium]